jgi:O-succinylbenzoic acid--CoA ligase
VIAPGKALSYSELADAAHTLAGDMPPLLPLNLAGSAHFAALLHAAALAGTAIAPLNPELPKPVLPAALPPGTLAVMSTSGTSGEPRPIPLTRTNFEASARASAAHLGVAAYDRWLCCLPIFHVGGLSILIRSALYSTTAVVEEKFDAQRVKDLLESREVTIVSLVPTMLARLRDAGFERADGLRALLLGGGPIPDELFDWAIAVGLPVMATYGMTETTSQVATSDIGTRAARRLSGVELDIADDGEILVRGPMVAADGWFHTGDRGRLTEDGLLEVEGRMDDLIVTGGENVAAAEVEAALLEHPAVTDAAVIGVDDPEWGRAVTAFVVAAAGEDDIAAHARAKLPGFKAPKRIYVVDELPRTASGKVQRAQLESRAHDLRQRR